MDHKGNLIYDELRRMFCSSRKPTSSRAMKLGGKAKDVDSFVDQLKSEGESVAAEISAKKPAQTKAPVIPQIPTERCAFIVFIDS